MIKNNPITYNNYQSLFKSPYMTMAPSYYLNDDSDFYYYFIEPVLLKITVNNHSTMELIARGMMVEDSNLIFDELGEPIDTGDEIIYSFYLQDDCVKLTVTSDDEVDFTLVNPPILERKDALEHKIYSELTTKLLKCESLKDYRNATKEFQNDILNMEMYNFTED